MYLVSVPSTDKVQSFETEDLQTQLIASLYGLPSWATENVRMVHRVPKTEYSRKHWKTGEVHDKFIMWSFQGQMTDAQLEEIKQNPALIRWHYEGEPIDMTSFWLAMVPELENLDVSEE